MFKYIMASVLCGLLGACSGTKQQTISGDYRSGQLYLTPVQFSDINSWEQNNFSHSLQAFKKSCRQISSRAVRTQLGQHPFFGSGDDWNNACQNAQSVTSNQAKQFFEQKFQPVKVSNKETNMFTGYYEPELRGSFSPDNQYRYPLYERPIGSGILPTRAQIVNGALNGRAKPILWVDSEIDSFFLHIQGSGRVRLPDNRIVKVAYGGQNGHQYYAIGKHLIDRGAIPRERMSAQAIKDWLNRNPSQSQQVMNKNPSYVFFKLENSSQAQSAKGAAGVPLTPEYSLAVDHTIYPYGLPMWIETGVKVPTQQGLKEMAFERLMIAQDTGGAIKGAIRGDIFFGSGKVAEIMASEQKYSGNKYLLLPKKAIASAN